MSNPVATFAIRLAQLRVQRNWSQKTLAGKSGVSGQMVHLIECGKSAPSLRTAYALAAALGTTIDAMTGQVTP